MFVELLNNRIERPVAIDSETKSSVYSSLCTVAATIGLPAASMIGSRRSPNRGRFRANFSSCSRCRRAVDDTGTWRW